MKVIKLFFISVLAISGFICQAQIVVRVKPAPPRGAIIIAPGIAPNGKIWVGGHMVVKGNKYYWQDGHYTNNKPRHRYAEGHWKKNRSGWVWVPCHCRRGR